MLGFLCGILICEDISACYKKRLSNLCFTDHTNNLWVNQFVSSKQPEHGPKHFKPDIYLKAC